MPDFIDFLPEFEFSPGLTSDNFSGKLSFKQADNPSPTMLPNVVAEAALPAIGSLFPAIYHVGWVIPSTLILRNVTITNEGGDLTKNKKYVMSYATKDDSGEESPSDEDQVESLTISSRSQTINTELINNAERIKAGLNKVKEVTIVHLMASYTLTVPGFTTLVLAAASGSPTGQVDAANKNWLMLGTSVTQYRDDEGVTLFKAARSYSYRKIQGPVGRVDDNTWLANWGNKVGKWQLADPATYSTGANVDTMPAIL